MTLLIVSLGWFPIQVTLASSFTMPVKIVTQAGSISKIAAQVNRRAVKSVANCDMHELVKECCKQSADCHQSDQECGHCLSFIAMTYDGQKSIFPVSYSIQNESNSRLVGGIILSAYRPPR